MQFGNIGTILVFFVREIRIVEYIFSFFTLVLMTFSKKSKNLIGKTTQMTYISVGFFKENGDIFANYILQLYFTIINCKFPSVLLFPFKQVNITLVFRNVFVVAKKIIALLANFQLSLRFLKKGLYK